MKVESRSKSNAAPESETAAMDAGGEGDREGRVRHGWVGLVTGESEGEGGDRCCRGQRHGRWVFDEVYGPPRARVTGGNRPGRGVGRRDEVRRDERQRQETSEYLDVDVDVQMVDGRCDGRGVLCVSSGSWSTERGACRVFEGDDGTKGDNGAWNVV